jgi:ribosome-binding protein aMBF1 (putative translation factor)
VSQTRSNNGTGQPAVGSEILTLFLGRHVTDIRKSCRARDKGDFFLQNEKELGVTIRAAMRKKNLNKDQLAQILGISSTMVEKLVCGEIVPSRH